MCHMQGRLTRSNVIEFSFKDLIQKNLHHVTHKNHVTLEESSWQSFHCFMPYQVLASVPTHLQQVSKPKEWAEVGRVLDNLPGGQEDQPQRPTGNCCET